VAEYNTCNRFWNLHRELQVGSVIGHCGRIYVGDFVRYQIGTEISSSKVQFMFMENNKIFLEIRKMLRFTHIPTYLHGYAEDTFGVGIPDDGYFLRFTSPTDPDCVVVMADDILESGSCQYIQLSGFLKKSQIEIEFRKAPTEYISSSYYEHPARQYARQNGLSVLLVPINMFSDEKCGNIFKAPIIFEHLSFSLANLPFKSQCDTVNNYVLSLANGVKAMEQISAVIDEPKDLEEGVLGKDGLTGEKVLIISPISAFLGDNSRQATISMLRGTTSTPNCCKCLRRYNMPLNKLARHRKKSQQLYYSNLLKDLYSNPSRKAQLTFKRLRQNMGIEFPNNCLLSLKYFDPYMHTPIEILHTSLQGFGKYLLEELKIEIALLAQQYKCSLVWLTAWCDIVSVSDCNSFINTANIFQKKMNFVGREMKAILQYGYYFFRCLLTEPVDSKIDRWHYILDQTNRTLVQGPSRSTGCQINETTTHFSEREPDIEHLFEVEESDNNLSLSESGRLDLEENCTADILGAAESTSQTRREDIDDKYNSTNLYTDYLSQRMIWNGRKYTNLWRGLGSWVSTILSSVQFCDKKEGRVSQRSSQCS
jgi:hypothetical protein